ncbi:MAG: PSD1 and planctomycete cytochrome C domain-containing protein, partial [Planctomycetia bacterium]
AGLRLDSRSGWERGGERGPAIVPGDPASSLLMRVIAYQDEDLKMPPEDAGGQLTQAEQQDLATWIRQGAHDPRVGEKVVTNIEAAARDHWAFQPVAAPKIEGHDHPIDLLIQQKLQQRGFTTTEPADMHTLIRRSTFDLHGLPPTAEQLQVSRENYPQLIKDLLNSPRYGERWGRHWLDVARYSDAKDGVLMYGDARIRPFAYTYRDYVIRAFNSDKPWDQFIREQLAADRLNLPPDSPELAAMGLLTLGRMFDRNRHDVIDDQIDVVGRGFLGLTLACARCHDHKFDPIPTADYYSLYGVFASSTEPLDRPRIGPITEAGQAFETEFSAKLKQVTDQESAHYESILSIARERTPDYLVHVATTAPDVSETAIFFLSLVPDQLRPQITKRWRQTIARRAFPDDPVFGPWHDLMKDATLRPDEWKSRGVDQRIIDGLVAAAPATPADVARVYGTILREVSKTSSDSSDQLVALLVGRDGPVWFPQQDVTFYLDRTPGDAFRGLVGELDAIAVRHASAAPRAMVVHDSDVLCDPVIFQRGDPVLRGTPVPRQFLSALTKEKQTPFADGAGRLDLANAVASPNNPLTARVWANRVWMHHFGESLVENPGDFGLQTKAPLHRELLDFLADYLVRHEWHTKALHELIMSSQTFQRSSAVSQTPAMTTQLQQDPANTFYWRTNRRRLDFEQMRDSLLSISGELDVTMFGRPTVITDETNVRRTVYAFVERQNIPAMVQTFDFANADTSTPRRSMTTVPQQALFALNSPFMLKRAKAMAARVTATEPAAAVSQLYQLAYGRVPDSQELADCMEYLQQDNRESLAQILLMSNELMFVD